MIELRSTKKQNFQQLAESVPNGRHARLHVPSPRGLVDVEDGEDTSQVDVG
jgi:hypothetical protein